MVKWSFPARDDLQSIYDYIVKDSKKYADKVVDDILEFFKKTIKILINGFLFR